MKRILCLLCTAVVPGLSACSGPREEPKPPNVLLVTIDTLRADHLSTYGYARETSPGLDRLAADGAVFENAYVAASFSGPSYATILTGTFPFTHTVRNHPRFLPYRSLTLAEVLSEAGYRTGAIVFGKHFINQKWNYSQGFDRYLLAPGGPATTDKAERWMLQGREPFFLWLLYNEPHFAYRPPGPFDEMFGAPPEGYSLIEDVRSSKLNKQVLSFAIERVGLSPAEIEHTIALYDGEIAFTDRLLSGLFDKMDRAGLLERTLVIVTADHGEALGEEGQFFTHDASISEAALHVPLILRLPGTIPAGARVPQVVRSADIAPTILDAVSLPVPEEMEGVSLLPALRGVPLGLEAYAESRRQEPSRMALGLTHYPLQVPGLRGKQRMLRSGDLKIIRTPQKSGRIQYRLYDVSADPTEQRDLAGERRKDLAAMKARLREWLVRDTKPESMGELDREDREKLRALGYID